MAGGNDNHHAYTLCARGTLYYSLVFFPFIAGTVEKKGLHPRAGAGEE
jgi:hypothetical protein